MSLWRESGAWRWLTCLSAFAFALALIGGPWRSSVDAGAPFKYASFDTAAAQASLAKPRGPGPVPVATRQAPSTAGSGMDQLDVAHLNRLGSPVPSTAGPAQSAPQTSSGVVWSNRGDAFGAGGSVSGGGLVASYCCAGALSSVWANTGIGTGRHYWELTLSVQTGQARPGTWTSAGVASRALSHASIVAPGGGQAVGTLAVEVGRKPQIRDGDVLMFAVDAERGLAYWGLNGQWQNGLPGQQGGHSLGALPPGGQWTPYVSLSAWSQRQAPEGDRWIANFGAQKFRYPIPAGFGSYGTTAAITTAPLAVPSLAGLPDSPIGRIVSGSVVVSGQTVPLPAGAWTTLARFNGSATAPGEAMVLGLIRPDRTMRRMIALHAHRGASEAATASFPPCQRSDLLHQSVEPNVPAGTQRCWWINHATAVWSQQGFFKAVGLELSQRGVVPAEVWLNVGFRRANAEGYVTAFHYFDPQEQSLASQASSWAQSEWHKSRIAADPQRLAYVDQIKDWGLGWAPIFFATR